MARTAKVLKAIALDNLAKSEGEYNAGGVDGTLLLRVRLTSAGNLSKAWQFVTRKGGKTAKFSLGAYSYKEKPNALTLAQAREEARKCLEDIKSGNDPRAKKVAPTFEDVKESTVSFLMESCLSEWEKNWRNLWKNHKSLEDYKRLYRMIVLPQLGNLSVNAVTATQIAAVLSPIMLEHQSKASKVKDLLLMFFRWCLQGGFRNRDLGNPASGESLKGLLPRKDLCKAVKHYTACPLADLPRFVRWIVADGRINNISSMAFLFILLTASRQGESIKNPDADRVKYVEWRDIDLSVAGRETWIAPAEKMKAGKNGEHPVPLSKQAVALLRRMERLGLHEDEGAIFVTNRGAVVQIAAVYALIHRVSALDLKAGGNGFYDPQTGKLMTPHGTARACFQSWAGARANTTILQMESALHHSALKLGDTYMRSKLTEERRPLMQEWADFLFSECPSDWDEIKA